VIAMYMKEGYWPAIHVTTAYRVQLVFLIILTFLPGFMPGLLL
jgi:hypothetical protein